MIASGATANYAPVGTNYEAVTAELRRRRKEALENRSNDAATFQSAPSYKRDILSRELEVDGSTIVVQQPTLAKEIHDAIGPATTLSAVVASHVFASLKPEEIEKYLKERERVERAHADDLVATLELEQKRKEAEQGIEVSLCAEKVAASKITVQRSEGLLAVQSALIKHDDVYKALVRQRLIDEQSALCSESTRTSHEKLADAESQRHALDLLKIKHASELALAVQKEKDRKTERLAERIKGTLAYKEKLAAKRQERAELAARVTNLDAAIKNLISTRKCLEGLYSDSYDDDADDDDDDDDADEDVQ